MRINKTQLWVSFLLPCLLSHFQRISTVVIPCLYHPCIGYMCRGHKIQVLQTERNNTQRGASKETFFTWTSFRQDLGPWPHVAMVWDSEAFSVQFSYSVMSDSLRPLGLQHARSPCPSPTLKACSNSCPLSQWCHPTISSSVVHFSSCLQSFPIFRIFSNESVLHISWSKYWSFSISISLSSEYSGLISFRIDWFDLLAVQGTLKSLLQHHSSKAPVPWCSAFFIVQLSDTYMITGKTIALTRWNFVGKVMSLLFNMLSRLVIAFCPRSKHLLISWLQSPSAVILEPQK